MVARHSNLSTWCVQLLLPSFPFPPWVLSSPWKKCFGPIRSSLSYHGTRAKPSSISISFALNQWKNGGLMKKAPRGCVSLYTFRTKLIGDLLCPCYFSSWKHGLTTMVKAPADWRSWLPVALLTTKREVYISGRYKPQKCICLVCQKKSKLANIFVEIVKYVCKKRSCQQRERFISVSDKTPKQMAYHTFRNQKKCIAIDTQTATPFTNLYLTAKLNWPGICVVRKYVDC